MAYQQNSAGLYQVPLEAFGNRLQDNFGLRVREHPAFGGALADVHAPNSYHKYGEAIDITDFRDDEIDGVSWQQRTANLRDLLRGAGPEVIGPGDMEGHDTHLHLAAKGGVLNLTPNQYNYFFGGQAGGKAATFQPMGDLMAPPEGPPASQSHAIQAEAKDRAQNYASMSKAQLDAAYDANRDSKKGLEMHKAFFKKA